MSLNDISNKGGFKRGQLSTLKIPRPTPFNDRQLFIEVMLRNAGINPHKMSNNRIYPPHSVIPILEKHQMKVMTLRMLGLIDADYGRWPFLSVGTTLKRSIEDFKLTPVAELISTSKTESADVISTYLKLAVDRDYVKLCKDHDLFEPPKVHVPIVTGKVDNMSYGVVVTRGTDKSSTIVEQPLWLNWLPQS